MKYWLRLFLLIGFAIAIIAIIGSLLPRSYDFTVTQTIDAPSERIFPLVNRLSDWPKWSRQFNPDEIDGLTIQYNGVKEGKGAAQTWKDVRGEGKLWIVESEPNSSIEFDSKFTNFPVMNNQFRLKESEGTTSVEWRSYGSLPGGPFYGYFGGLFTTHMRDQYEKSLLRLKEICEQ